MNVGFYVSIIQDPDAVINKKGCFALGPFATHEEALTQVDIVKRHCEQWLESHWWGYGTCRIEAVELPVGRFNTDLLVRVYGT